jgi:hypothetical protein
MAVYQEALHNYVPKEAGERLILRFEGAAYNICVFINGIFVGSHDGSSTLSTWILALRSKQKTTSLLPLTSAADGEAIT